MVDRPLPKLRVTLREALARPSRYARDIEEAIIQAGPQPCCLGAARLVIAAMRNGLLNTPAAAWEDRR